MKIRTRLSLQFTLITGTILFVFSFSVFFFSAWSRSKDFSARIKNRALTTGKLMLDVEEVDSDLLRQIDENTFNALENERTAVFSDNHLIYEHSDNHDSIRISESVLSEIKEKREMRFDLDGQEAIGVYLEGKDNAYTVVVSAVDASGMRHLQNLKFILISGFLFAIVIKFITGFFFTKQMFKPLMQMISQVKQITASSLSLRLDDRGKKDEISTLAVTFNGMLERLEQAFEIQKRFVSNASHELRTPLTAITGQIEVTLLKKRSEEEYGEILSSILEDIRKLNAMTNGLLKMAQAGGEEGTVKIRELRIDELLWTCREELLKLHPDYAVSFSFSESEDLNLVINGNESLLKTAFLNLLDNACKFSSDHSASIHIYGEKNVKVVISDNGPGISEPEISKIFQPFYRSEKTKGVPGHGLGLSLTDMILKLHHAEINFESSPGRGTRITIDFPVSENV